MLKPSGWMRYTFAVLATNPFRLMNTSSQTVLPIRASNIERLDVLDALRGFALIGIIVIHASTHFLATMAPPSVKTLNLFSPVDNLLGEWITWLAFGKFFTIFSFLFGLSFAIQMDRVNQGVAEPKGQTFVRRMMLRRFAILFVLGYLHTLIYSGDVLCLYAVLGVILLSLRKLANKLLLIGAMAFVMNLPLFISRIHTVIFPPTPVQIAAGKAWLAIYVQYAERVFQTYQQGTLVEVIQLHAKSALASNLFGQLYTGRLFITFGMFLLGLWAGRKQLFADTPQHHLLFRKLLIWSGLLATLSTAVWIYLTGGRISWSPLPGWLEVIAHTAYNAQQTTLSACYVLSFTLLFWQRRTWLPSKLVAVGRMGLTTYLGGSAFGILVFRGYGLNQFGHLGLAASVGLGLLFFGLQILFSNWWLTHYYYGPVEWVWRSLTYGKAQPWRRTAQKQGIASEPVSQ